MTKKVGSTGRFGARYGKTVRERLAKLEEKQRAKQYCPYCGKQIKRVSKGVWYCKSCKTRFASSAFYLEKSAT